MGHWRAYSVSWTTQRDTINILQNAASIGHADLVSGSARKTCLCLWRAAKVRMLRKQIMSCQAGNPAQHSIAQETHASRDRLATQ